MKVFDRKKLLGSLKKSNFDLLIIGGGITGAGIALDAASRGLKTALVEQNDFASGTSSKSTKLIHGGLRYLKNLEFGFVRTVGQERAILNKNAPHLAYPKPMLLPFYKNKGLGKWSTIFGVFLYEMLAGVKKSERFRLLNTKEVIKREPLLRPEKLRGGCLYTEYQTNDSRLVIELIKASHLHNATCLNYVEVVDLNLKNGKVCGALLYDKIGQSKIKISAETVIGAVGPWTDCFLKKTNSKKKKKLFLTKGAHLVFSQSDLPINNPVYFPVKDGRMVFAIPRLKHVYVGTTDTPFKKDISSLSVKKEDVKYLTAALSGVFSISDFLEKKLVSSWAGLRPLILGRGSVPSEISRKEDIFVSKNNLITIAGGKLTGYRIMAKKAVDLVFKQTRRPFVSCKTKQISLTQKEPQPKAVFLKIKSLALKLGGDSVLAEYLFYTYGKQGELMLRSIKKENGSLLDLEKKEMAFAKKYEAVVFDDDYKKRRAMKNHFPLF